MSGLTDKTAKPPVLLLHGLWGRPALFEPWIRRLEAAGFECHAPTLPGRDPTDKEVLGRSSLRDFFDVALEAYDGLSEPPIVLGHSVGGLLGQKLAAERDCPALVLLASVAPGVFWTQLRALPHFLPLLPSILAARPIPASASTMRAVPLSTLPESEQDDLIPRLVWDSGRVFRELLLGSRSTRVKAADVTCPVLCVSGGADRNVAPWVSRRIAARYHAEHQVHPGLPHWIIAQSALDEVVPPVMTWLQATLNVTIP